MTTINGNSAGMPQIKAAVPKWEDGCPVVFSNDVPVHIHKPDENTQKDDISIYDEINKKEKEIAEMQKYLEEIMPKNIEAEKEIEEKMHSIGKPTED